MALRVARRAAPMALILAGAVLFPPQAAEAETRCGWFVNPTPGNFWLVDGDGEWDIAWQGQEQPPGFDTIPDMSVKGWVETNGYYGYGCGCVSGKIDKSTKKFKRISGAEPKALAFCRTDKRLPSFEQ